MRYENEKDYIMRMIKEMVRVLFSLMLGKHYVQVEPEIENKYTVSGTSLGEFKAMVDRGEPPAKIARHCLEAIASVLDKMCSRLLEELGPLPVVFSGGVCSNSLLRQRLGEKYSATFAAPEFSSDNAAGVAVLAWKKRCQG